MGEALSARDRANGEATCLELEMAMVKVAGFWALIIALVQIRVAWPAITVAAAEFWKLAKQEQFAGAVIAATAAISVFVLSRIVDFSIRARDRDILRRRLIIGLYDEIETNLLEIGEFVATDDFARVVGRRIEQDSALPRKTMASPLPIFRPLIVISESSRFFQANAGLIPELNVDVLVPLMEFYRALEELDRRQAAFESKAFETISVESRVASVYDLWNTGKAAETYGKAALAAFQMHYSRGIFRRLETVRKNLPKPAVISPAPPTAPTPAIPPGP